MRLQGAAQHGIHLGDPENEEKQQELRTKVNTEVAAAGLRSVEFNRAHEHDTSAWTSVSSLDQVGTFDCDWLEPCEGDGLEMPGCCCHTFPHTSC